jgi:Tol biopolymer transport system component
MMEHNDNEQRANLDAYQSFGQPHPLDASASFVPGVLTRLGLSQTAPSPTMSEEQVVDALNSPAWPVRLAAVQQLEMLAERVPLAALVRALHDKHETVRAAAVRALGMLASRAPVEPLVDALRDSEWTVRAAAALALGKLKGRTPVEPLVAALHDEDASVRATAAWALGTLGEQAPLAPLANALHDSAWTVREAAVLALGEVGARVPAALLLAARSDGDEPVRQVAELVLQHIYPELLASTSMHTIASVSEHEASTSQHVKLNGHHNHDLKSIWPKQQKRLQREPVLARPRLFPRVAAGVLAALVIIAAMFSWFAVLHRPQVSPSGHTTAIPTSNIATYRAAGGSVYRVAWSPDGTEIASTNAVGLVQIWDIVTGHTISTYRGNFLKVLSLVWSPGHSLLVTAEGTDRTVQVWNALTGKRILTTPPLNGIASVATWSPDGRQIAFDGGDNTVQVWNIVTGKWLLTYTGHTGRVTALSWSPDGTEIASASDDGTVQVWNAATGHKDWPSFVHADAVSVVAWSPDGKRCAVATVRGLVEVWDNPSWQKVQIAPADEGWSDLDHPLVVSIAWSPDGTRLTFTTAGGLVQVWDASTTRLLYTYPGHTEQVNDVAWSPDGTHIASASDDGTVQVWPSPSSFEGGKLRMQ